VQKVGNDQVGGKAIIIAYYGLFELLPLLLLFTTILGFALAGNPGFQRRVLNSALANFSIIGQQLRSATRPETSVSLDFLPEADHQPLDR
jgi:uncharacterized BrkB/YihY/UPF0761 family membrane protein